MIKALTTCLLTSWICGATGLAGVTYISQTRTQPGHPSVVDIAPIPGAAGGLEGFLLCDSNYARLTVLSPQFDTAYTLALDHPPVAAVAFRSFDNDTLYLCAAAIGEFAPVLTLFTMTAEQRRISTYSPKVTSSPGRPLARSCTLQLDFANGRPTELVLTVSEIVEEQLVTQGVLTEARPRAYIFTLDDREFRPEIAADRAAIGDFDGDWHADIAGSRALWSRWGEPISAQPPLDHTAELGVTANRTTILARHRREASEIRALTFLDLSAFAGFEELVVLGSGADWLANHAGRQDYLASYSFTGDRVEELWYRREENLRLLSPQLFQWHLAAVRGRDRLILFEPQSGEPVDSVLFDHSIDHVRFCPLSDPSGALLLTGRARDTLVTVRIDRHLLRTTSSDNPESTVPATFTLEQNYPNPFNGSTQIHITNTLAQHLSLRIYNVLGQEIATLIDYVLAPGDYDYTWDATDNFGEFQGSGIYFAQLKSSTESHIIKLIYLK